MNRKEAGKYIHMGATPKWLEAHLLSIESIPMWADARFKSVLTNKKIWIPDNVLRALAERWGLASEKNRIG